MANTDPKAGGQGALFQNLDEEHWRGLPRYDQFDKSPYHSLLIHFTCEAEIAEFHERTGIPRTKHRTFWFKQPEYVTQADKRWIDPDTKREIEAETDEQYLRRMRGQEEAIKQDIALEEAKFTIEDDEEEPSPTLDQAPTQSQPVEEQPPAVAEVLTPDARWGGDRDVF